MILCTCSHISLFLYGLSHSCSLSPSRPMMTFCLSPSITPGILSQGPFCLATKIWYRASLKVNGVACFLFCHTCVINCLPFAQRNYTNNVGGFTFIFCMLLPVLFEFFAFFSAASGCHKSLLKLLQYKVIQAICIYARVLFNLPIFGNRKPLRL